MRVQNQRRSRPGAIIVLVLLIGLSLLAIWQFPPTQQSPSQAPTTADSQRLVRNKPFVIWFTDEVSTDDDGNKVPRPSDGTQTLPLPFPTPREAAELHSLYRMRTYQDRVIRVLHSRTPVFPNTMAPTFEELLLENADAD